MLLFIEELGIYHQPRIYQGTTVPIETLLDRNAVRVFALYMNENNELKVKVQLHTTVTMFQS